MECLENGGKFYFLNIWRYLKELHMGQSTQRLERKKQSVLRVSLYKTGEDIQRPISPVCSHCSLFLMLVLQLYSPAMLAESWDWQPWGLQTDQGGELGKISFPEHCTCLAAFCVFAREVTDQSLALLGFYHQPHLTIHVQIISKKNPANYWKQHILKGSHKTISQDLYSLQHLLLSNRFFLKNIILSGAIAPPLYFESFNPPRL